MSRPLAAPLSLFLLAFGAYGYFYQAGGWNQNSRLDLTRAIVDEHRLAIDTTRRNTGDEAKRGEHFYCDKAPGISLAGVPVYAAFRAAGGQRPDAAAYWVTLFAVSLPVAASVVALFVLGQALGATAARSAGVALAYGMATLIFPYATLLYGHAVVAALLLGAFAILVRAPEPSAGALAAVGALLGWAVVVEYPAALGVVVLVGYAATRVRPARLGWIVLGGLAPAAVLAAYHTLAFGGPTVLPYSFSTQKHRHMGFFMGLGVPHAHALGIITISMYRGLFVSAPWLALALPGAVRLLRARATRAVAVVCLVVTLLVVWLNASLVDYDGGWTFGARYLIPAVPFLAILVLGWPRGRLATPLFAILVAVSAALMLVATAVKPEVPSWIALPLQQYLLPQLWRGELAVSTQSIDSLVAPVGGPRFAWNLGQLVGLRGLASLVPLVVWIGATGAWLIASLRRLGGGVR